MTVSVEGWRLAQIFLSKKPAVFEVEIHIPDAALRCTCPGFTRFKRCKHTDWVAERIDRENQTYAFETWQNVTPEDAEWASQSPENYRRLVIDHAKVQVL